MAHLFNYGARNPFHERRRLAREATYLAAASHVAAGVVWVMGGGGGCLGLLVAVAAVVSLWVGVLRGLEAAAWMRRARRPLGRAGWMGLSVALYAGAIAAWVVAAVVNGLVR